jgi:DNA-directed RNA polymerase beta subunit
MPENQISEKEFEKQNHVLVKNYLQTHSLVESNITSFNDFIEHRMQQIVHEVSDSLPKEDVEIELGKIKVGNPNIIEADGSEKNIYPAEARLRNLTYSAPVTLEINVRKDGKKEFNTVEIGRFPIMVQSRLCNLSGMTKEELIKSYNDPIDSGGYFVVNGNERLLIMIEDLAPNIPFIEESAGKAMLRLFSARGAYRIPMSIQESPEGLFVLSFSRFRNLPLIPMIKALGMVKDSDIMAAIGKEYDSVIVNLYEYASLQNQNDALMAIAGKMGIEEAKKEMIDKTKARIDSYLLPHIGVNPDDKEEKARTLCKLLKQFLIVFKEKKFMTDKDHYANKRIKLSGDLLSDLFRVNLTILVRDIQHKLQRVIRKKKFYSLKTLAKATLFSHRIESAIATGTWIGERTGVTQNMDKTNYLAMLSKLQMIVSMLPSEQENFPARTLHPTHFGRFCPIETPEGTTIGLRKNLALLSKISTAVHIDEAKFLQELEAIGMKRMEIKPGK